jgi:hypothetical protein
VRGERRQIDVELLDVERCLAHALNGVGVQQHAALARDGADFLDGLHGADLVVGEHDRHQDGVVGDGAPHGIGIDDPRLVDAEVGDLEAFLLEALAGVEHRLVLDDRGDDVVALLAVEVSRAFDRQVVALGRARGEDDLLGLGGTDEPRDLRARVIHRFFGLPAKGMAAAGGVAEALAEIRQHRLEHPRIDGRRGVVVHVDGKLECHGAFVFSVGVETRDEVRLDFAG